MPRPRTRSPPPTRSLSADSPDNDLHAPEQDAEHAAWVAREYPALKDSVYLDHAAAPPVPAAPLAALASSIQSQLFSNPHSSSTAGVQTALVIDRTRTRVLQDLFNVPDDRLAEWDVVFTHGGATQGIKLIGDSWDWGAESEGTAALEYLVESHTSLVGLRGYPLARGRTVKAHRTPSDLLQSAAQSCSGSAPTLYAYPAQCNATGARLGLRCAAQIKRANPNAKILVDAAAYCSTSILDLGAVPAEEAPDFVVASVYKVFGFPTSLGLLLVRRASAHLLTHSPYFGGGTISSLALFSPFSHVPRLRPSPPSQASISAIGPPDASITDIHTILEAGTPPFLEIVALSHALDWLDGITQGEGLGAVSRRTKRLRLALVSQLQALRHADGSEVFVEHTAFRAGAAAGLETMEAIVLEEPGPILGFSLRLPGQLPPEPTAHHDSGGGGDALLSTSHSIEDYRTAFVGHVTLSRLALVNGIAIRSGGLCNTGAWTRVWGMEDRELHELEKSGRKCWDEEEFAPFAPYRPLGITRVSLGLASTMADVSAFVSFVKKFFVQTSVPRPLLPSDPTPSQNTLAPHIRKARLTEIMLYPIKSCAAQSVLEGSSWPLTSSGLLYDREYMLVSASTGRALSQKRYPRMALIRPRIDLDRGELVVEAKGMPTLRLPLVLETDDSFCHAAPTTAGAESTKSELPPTPPLSEEECSDSGVGGADTSRSLPPQSQMTNLCGSSVASIGVSAAADAWFTTFLNPSLSPSSSPLTGDSLTKTTTPGSVPRRDAAGPGPVELHRLPNGSARHAHFDGPGAAVGPPLPLRLSNESPFLLVSEESLGALNEWISECDSTDTRSSSMGDESRAPIRAHSFRPNLVVGNGDSTSIPLAPFWEERVDQFSISQGGLNGSSQSFSTLGKCRRCLMVAIDQNTGERTAEPLQTLTQHKKAADTGRVEFGMHCMWHEPAAATEAVTSVSVGDLVTFTL